ncbi:MAG: chromate transporter [Armatimonadia bacterium]
MIWLLQLAQMTWVFLRVGALVFGGGMVMIPILQQDVVTRHQWLTQREFVDAVALGQMTPGPLLVSATFVGYKAMGGGWSGLVGATAATVAIFLPSFLMTILLAGQLTRMRGNPIMRGFLRGVNVAVVGLIMAALVSIAKVSFEAAADHLGLSVPAGNLAYRLDPFPVAIAIVGTVALLRYKVEAVYVILGAALLGLLIYR